MEQNNIDNMCIGELSSVLYRQFQIYIHRQMKKYGINSSEFMFIVKIGIEPINQKQISDSLCVDYAIATRSLRSLEEKGLVLRSKSDTDARATMVALTEKGADIKKIGLQIRQKWKENIMGDLAKEESEFLLNIIKDMAKKAISQTKGGGMFNESTYKRGFL